MSELIGRELVEAIEELIILHIAADKYAHPSAALKERIELVKRDLTDALLAMDSRKGVYVSGTPIHR